MKNLLLCACLALAYGQQEITISPWNSIKSSTDSKGSESSLNDVVLDIHEHNTADPLIIRSNVPKELIIPSVPADQIGLNQEIRVSPYKLESYPTASLSGFGYENNYPTIDFGRDLPSPNIGYGVPAEQIGFSPGFEPVLNFDSSFKTPLDIKQIPSFNPIINYSPNLPKSSSFQVEPATSVDKFAFSQDGSFNVNTYNIASTNGSSSLDTLNNNIKEELPTKVTYSIESVPEVASIHKTGPFVPSDIPSISELLKIFNSQSTKVDNVSPSKTIIENSDEEILGLIEERMGQIDNKKEKSSSSVNYEGRTLNNEDSVSDETLSTETLLNKTDSGNLTENESTTLNSINAFDDLEELINKTQTLGKTIGGASFRSSENDDIVELKQPEVSSNFTITTADNSNNNDIILVTPVPTLNASNFINASDILKESVEFKLIAEPSKLESDSSKNTTEETHTEKTNTTILELAKPLSISDNNAENSQTDVSELVNGIVSDQRTKEAEKLSVQPPDSTILEWKIASNLINSPIDNLYETNALEAGKETDKLQSEIIHSSNSENSSISLQVNLEKTALDNSNVGELAESLDRNAKVSDNDVSLNDENLEKSETTEPQDLETTTTNVSDKKSNVESRFAQEIEPVGVTEVLETTVTELNESEDTSTVKTDTVHQEVSPLFNSSILNMLCSGKTI